MNDFVLDSCNKLSSLDSLNQNEDLASINHQLYKLLQSTNIDIDYQIFRYLIYELNDCPLIIIICIIFWFQKLISILCQFQIGQHLHSYFEAPECD